MTQKFAFSYCLLQYKHNHWLHERLNIGVLLFSEQSRFLKIKTRSWNGRITKAYPDIDKAAFSEDLRQIKRAINSYAEKNLAKPSLFPDYFLSELVAPKNVAQALARALVPLWLF